MSLLVLFELMKLNQGPHTCEACKKVFVFKLVFLLYHYSSFLSSHGRMSLSLETLVQFH